MSKSKAFKIISHLSQAVVLEEELFEEQDLLYSSQFAKDFALEQEFLRDMQMFKVEQDDLKKIPKTELQEKTLKSLHKKLALKTHPDKNNGDDNEFKKIQSAYDNKDTAALLAHAISHDIDIKIEEKDIKAMMDDVHNRKAHLQQRKNTIRWVWGESNKGEDIRKLVRAAMQIEESVFHEWVKNRKS